MNSKLVKTVLNVVFIICVILMVGGIFCAGAQYGATSNIDKIHYAQAALFHLLPGLVGLLGIEWYQHKHK